MRGGDAYGGDWCAPPPVAPPSPWRAVAARKTPQPDPRSTRDPRGGKGAARLMGTGAHVHGALHTSSYYRDKDIGRAERVQRRIPPGCVSSQHKRSSVACSGLFAVLRCS